MQWQDINKSTQPLAGNMSSYLGQVMALAALGIKSNQHGWVIAVCKCCHCDHYTSMQDGGLRAAWPRFTFSESFLAVACSSIHPFLPRDAAQSAALSREFVRLSIRPSVCNNRPTMTETRNKFERESRPVSGKPRDAAVNYCRYWVCRQLFVLITVVPHVYVLYAGNAYT